MTANLFVYGTLRPRFENQWSLYLAERSRLVGEGVIEGDLYLFGWFPGLLAGDGVVQGDLLELLGDAEETLRKIDAYEGEDYFVREWVEVTLSAGEKRNGFTYRYIGPMGGGLRIESGLFVPPGL